MFCDYIISIHATNQRGLAPPRRNARSIVGPGPLSMVEPLAAAILTRPSLFKLPLNTMTRRPFPPDFFSPLPRKHKGKERAVEPPSDECNHCSLPTSSCTSRHSPWCPIRNRLFMMNHVLSRRSQPLSQSPRRSPRRHSSSAACIQTRLLDSSQTVGLPREPDHLSDKLRSILTVRTPLDPEQAWHLYMESIQAEAVDSVFTPGEHVQFIRRFFDAFELWGDTPPDLPLLHTWGTRLEPILRDLMSKLDGSSAEIIALKCCTAQAHAWMGDLAQASHLTRQTAETCLGHAETSTLLSVYQNILVLVRYQQGASHALDLLVQDWHFLGTFQASALPQAVSFNRAINNVLAHIPDGASLLAHSKQPDQHDRICAGKLLLKAYCAKGLLHQAHALVLEMRRQHLPVDFHPQIKLTRLLAQRKLFDLAHELFAPMDPSTDPRLYDLTGLYLYARCGDVDRAKLFFDKNEGNQRSMPVARCLLMHAFAVAGTPEIVVELFHKFFPATPGGDFLVKRPGVTHYTTVILAHADQGDFDGVDFWLEKMLQAGLRPDSHVYSIILQCFARRGDVDSVAATLDEMRAAKIKPDHVHYTSLLTLLARRKDVVAAESIFLRALREGVTPDRIMITSLMNAHVEAGSWQGVVRVFDYLRQRSRFRHDLPIEVYNTLLKANVLLGAPFRVVFTIFRKVIQVGVRPDGYTYALIIQSACDAGKMDVAQELFAEMDEKATSWGPHCRFDAYVLTIIMAGYVRRRSKARAKDCYEEMRRRGIKPNSIAYKQILQAYANDRSEDSLRIAQSFLRQLMDADAVDPGWIGTESRASALGNLYSPLMLVYAQKERHEEVVRLFNGMLDAGGEPSLESLTIVLDAHRRANNIDAVRQLWPQIWTRALQLSRADKLFKGDGAPTRRRSNLLCVPLSIYIDALSVAGEHHAVLDAWTRAKAEGFNFDAHNWNHLAVVLVRAGELDRAFEVLERVLIPYSRKCPINRDPLPETPLVFDVMGPDEDMTASNAPMRRKRRAKAVTFATRTVGSLLARSDESVDFAHALHILHQVIPGLSVWRPHAVTLQVLSSVLAHLQRGHLVEPIRSPDTPPATLENRTDPRGQAEIASATLRRIYHNYPEAVRAVLLYERGRARREAVRRSPKQWIQVKGQVVDT